MTKEELWEAYVTRNPKFVYGDKVTMSTRGLRKLFEQTWDKAYTQGGKDALQTPQNSSDSNRGENLFNQMFGGFRKR